MIRTLAYKAVMSTGDPILIDQDEIETVIKTLPTGQWIQVRGGLINPSFCVDVIPDIERIREYNHIARLDPAMRTKGMQPLQDIFSKQALRLGPDPSKGG